MSKFPKGPPRTRKAPTSRRSTQPGSLIIKIAAKDDAPMPIAQAREGLYELIRFLDSHAKGNRIKRATLYLTIVDDNGEPARISFNDEIVIRPYPCAADDFDEP